MTNIRSPFKNTVLLEVVMIFVHNFSLNTTY